LPNVYAHYAPSMNSEPCAKLTTRVTPKISVSPAATRNSAEAEARPFRNWRNKDARDTLAMIRGRRHFAQSAGRIRRTSSSLGW